MSEKKCTLNVTNEVFVFIFSFRGDIVIAKSPFDPNMNVCKRVIGLEGDKICTSGPSDLFKTHTYVSMFTSYKPIFVAAFQLLFLCIL